MGFKLRPSKWLGLLVALIVLGALMACVLAFLSWWLTFLCFIIIGCHGVYLFRQRITLTGHKAICALRWLDNSRWLLRQQNGEEIVARLCGDSFVSSYCVIMNFKIEQLRGKTSVMILPDALTRDAFRRLRVILKHKINFTE